VSRFVLISPDSEFDQRLRQAVTGGLPGNVQTFSTTSLPAQPEDLFAQLGPDNLEVLVLGPGVPLEDALRLATIFDIQVPEVSLVLVSESDPELVLHAMRAGIRDVLSPDVEPSEIRIILERACQAFASRHRVAEPEQPEQRRKGLVIGVFSPKGGVGKTTVATNLAVGLGKIAPMDVVIVDLDLQFGDVASGLYLDPERTVTDAVSPSASQDSLVLKAFLTMHPSNIYVLCAPKTPAEADEITAEQVTRLLEQLSEQFKYVVVDTAPGLSDLGLAAMEQCTDGVWVSGMDIPSVRGLRSGFEILRQLNLLPATRHLVLNMADSKTGLSVQDIESTIGTPVDVSIPRSKLVAYSTNRGIPALQEGKKDPAVKGLRQLVQRFDPAWRAKTEHKHRRRRVVIK
jgi:pilus assembly protein CpaE